MQTQQQTTDTRHAPPPEIGGRSWQVTAPGVAKCSVAPGHRPPAEAQAVTPDQRKGNGWRIAWLFLGTVACLIACPAAWIICRMVPPAVVLL